MFDKIKPMFQFKYKRLKFGLEIEESHQSKLDEMIEIVETNRDHEAKLVKDVADLKIRIDDIEKTIDEMPFQTTE